MFLKRQNKKKKGFTLIELIIVIAIIAILAAIAIPNFLSIQRKARVKADIASAKTIYDATSALIAEGKIVPTTNTVTFTLDNDKVTAKPEDAGEPKTNANAANALQSYLQTIPKPESIANQKFEVTVSGEENSPKIQVKIGESTNVYPEANEDYKLNK
ncbi:prepilin-type N-terminal cleavage/methylation domain-containing protein [Clostridium perfringens]|uniref:prepilin-type N-terminal cleavage/methylation domain-containing protein n=1 Tax=Clostridium perfringens TaxID=1502 RepID=UPI0013E2DC20|nr:prepilin-type N-terminal cleavage/methylation domain-containing protein [Clostridium perfringens]MCX0386324.1 prepilin-type N-terminal cleavage/methylation domain-containing protein [Clostridium perfringens]MDT7931847.1 prepilin-type N-terminal cleavage/methylation domain-containing protein [Clostridium perfringens]MDT7956235.1 prepilin-type N-terminal cleavage/methylation domain-containing protein [Clostridium perfringens]NGT55119.1 prepilin-type N-terminal cleavage/methylation domain-conta